MEVNKKVEEQRFEFLLRINGHIICQRYFNIIGYNERCLESFELNNMAFDCVKTIENNLKVKTREYLWQYYNPYKPQEVVEGMSKKGIYEDKIDEFQFEVRVDKRTVIVRNFSGNPYPPRVRYQVDIKSVIFDILGLMRDYMTQRKYTYKYSDSASVIHY